MSTDKQTHKHSTPIALHGPLKWLVINEQNSVSKRMLCYATLKLLICSALCVVKWTRDAKVRCHGW